VKASSLAALNDAFWGYAAGTVAILLTEAAEVTSQLEPQAAAAALETGGISINNFNTTLPVRKGLSSSAAVCVLVVRAFSTIFGWNLSHRVEMELAYRGERLTRSRCGRMDQACAFGKTPVLLVGVCTMRLVSM